MKRLALSLVLIVAVFSGCSRGPSPEHLEAVKQLRMEQDALIAAKIKRTESLAELTKMTDDFEARLGEPSRTPEKPSAITIQETRMRETLARSRRQLAQAKAQSDALIERHELLVQKLQQKVDDTKP